MHRAMMIGFGRWEFDPMELQNPFPNKEGSVHLWHGDEDGFVPFILQKYIAKRLPWIEFHEVRGGGHYFSDAEGMAEAIVRTLLYGRK